MTNEEAARILDPDTSREALRPYALDCVARMAVVEEACRLGAAALRERPEWIPVTERLPEAFVPVIVCRDGAPGERIVEQGHKDVGDWWKVYGTRTKRVTHWMPLPEFGGYDEC